MKVRDIPIDEKGDLTPGSYAIDLAPMNMTSDQLWVAVSDCAAILIRPNGSHFFVDDDYPGLHRGWDSYSYRTCSRSVHVIDD